MDAPLDTFRPSTLGWLRGTLAGWGTMLLALAGILATLMGYGICWLGLAAAALLILVWKWLENMAAKYEITEERLIIRRGIISKSIDEIELYRIKDVRIDFTHHQPARRDRPDQHRLVATRRPAAATSSCATSSAPQERREKLRRLVDTARQKRRVREIDMCTRTP